MATKAKAPFKRGTHLIYEPPGEKPVEVIYKRWWGFERSACIDVTFPDGKVRMVWTHYVRVKDQQ